MTAAQQETWIYTQKAKLKTKYNCKTVLYNISSELHSISQRKKRDLIKVQFG